MTSQPSPVPIEDLLVHREWVRGLARRLVHDENAVDEVEQETWLATLHNPPRERETVRAWLARVVRARVIDRRRSEGRRLVHETAGARTNETPATADLVARMDAHRRLVQAVMELDEPYRTTIILRFHEGLPPRDVAPRMDVPVETVRTRTRRGLERLRASLDEEHGSRRAWCLLLLPLLADGPDVPVGAATGAGGLTLGAAIMTVTTKNVIAAALVVALTAVLVGTGVVPIGADAERETEHARANAASTDGAAQRVRIVGPQVHGGPPVTGNSPTPPLTVVVTDLQDTPIAGARVELHHATTAAARALDDVSFRRRGADGARPSMVVTTDSAGRSVAEGLDAGVWMAIAEADGRARCGSLATTLLAGGAPAELRIALGIGHTIEGTVFENDGAALPGAIVTAGSQHALRSVSDAAGRFRLVGVPAGRTMLSVARPTEPVVNVATVIVPDIRTVDLRLGGGTLTGTIVDAESGSPVANARLECWTSAPLKTTYAATTSADGTFTLRTSADGQLHQIEVRADGFAPLPALDPITLTGGSHEERTVRLERGARLSGVVTAGGDPVANADVRAESWGTRAVVVSSETTTDSNGRYVLHGVQPGEVIVLVSAAGCTQPDAPPMHSGHGPHDAERWSVELALGETAEMDVEMVAGVVVTGRVVDGNGEPASGALLGATGLRDAVVADRDGAFRLVGVARTPGAQVVAWREQGGSARAGVECVMRACSRVGVPASIGCEAMARGDDIMVGYLMFDALIGNTDRHHQNWGWVLDLDESRAFVAPTFDHASSLGRNESDERRRFRLETRDVNGSVEAYALRARAGLFDSSSGGASPSALRTIDAFRDAARMRPTAAQRWLRRLEVVADEALRRVAFRVPRACGSELASAFAGTMLCVMRSALLKMEF